MKKMKGIAYGVGVGPGDPELMTLKACRLIRENRVIALVGKKDASDPRESVAYQIAVQAVPELADKILVPIHLPMSMEKSALAESHRRGAKLMEDYLAQGENVVFLTLGDASLYCTFTYLQPYLEADGYESRLVSGIPSFCAAAARLNIPLAEWDEPLYILPGLHTVDGTERAQRPGDPEQEHAQKSVTPERQLTDEGTYVLMKSGSHMKDVKRILEQSSKEVQMVQNCGMPTERICRSLEEIPDDAGYFSLIIAKGADRKRNRNSGE